MGSTSAAYIGVDVGGTHTDVTVARGEALARGKALTTYDDFSRGMVEAIGVAAESLDESTEDLLGATELLVCGTTVVTNVLTELRGSQTGVLLSAGFRDTIRIAGGPLVGEFDDHLQSNVPNLVEPRSIREIDGRIDYSGAEVVALNTDQLEEEVRFLVEEQGVETLAVCFLWSFLNPEHELEAERRILALYPDVFVSLSHREHRLLGENRRWTTAIMNSFVQPPAQVFLRSVSTRLEEAGLRGSLVFCQGIGGAVSEERASRSPLSLLGSGPAGGAIGANALAERLGERDLLIADMGGTSFDTGLIKGNEIHIEKNLKIGRYKTGVSVIDVLSIGAGGGSIAWVSDRGVPQVGPHSARAKPGPACYGQGGTEPTVTDAMVLLGIIDAENYLGGRFELKPDDARDAMNAKLADRFGWSVEEAACAVHDLVVANMANAIREVTVKKGYDPRDFPFLAYGGTLPMFASQIAAALNVTEVIIPRNSSVFCAQGLLSSDYVLRNEQAVGWSLAAGDDVEAVNEIAQELVHATIDDMAAEGFAAGDVGIARAGSFRFAGQVDDLTMSLPDRPLTPGDTEELQERFVDLYERIYGAGTSWKGIPVQLTSYEVTGTAPGVRAERPLQTIAPVEPSTIEKARRRVFSVAAHEWQTIPIYDGGAFTPGTKVEGPCVIDETDTTVYVPEGTTAGRDELMSYRLVRREV